ncbi:hypothetical protein KAG47_11820, partial [Enterococcus faecalis]|uniref:hypothetical protein n=1 Tax=Enterococcus faecalis TaxID=1351 RepID=UPI001B32FED8
VQSLQVLLRLLVAVQSLQVLLRLLVVVQSLQVLLRLIVAICPLKVMNNTYLVSKNHRTPGPSILACSMRRN